jgi:dipeptide/tripeptide permease
MDKNVFGYELLSAQIMAANPFLIIFLIPVFTYIIYPFMGRFFELTAARKISMGMVFASTPFFIYATQATPPRGYPPLHQCGFMLDYVILFWTND